MEKLRGTVGICGAGQIGAAASVAFQRAGYRALVWVRRAEMIPQVNNELSRLGRWLDDNVGHAEMPGDPVEVTDSLDRVGRECGYMVEAIAEDMEQKVDLLTQLEAAGTRETIFVTTTSGLSITELGRRSATAPRLVGAHFWNPPHLMPLVEVIRGDDTQDGAFELIMDLVASIGKIPVRVNHDVPGFIGNRLLHALWREAINLVDRGIASPEDVDRVARLTFGLRLPVMGPLENMDVVGLDLVARIHRYLLADLSGSAEPQPPLTERVAEGRLGVKSGSGFYDWNTRSARKLIEERDQQIVRQVAYLKDVKAL